MKKIFSVLLCVILLVTLVGCAIEPNPSSTPQASSTAAPEPSSSNVPEETEKKEPEVIEGTKTIEELTFSYKSIEEPLDNPMEDGNAIFVYYPAEGSMIQVLASIPPDLSGEAMSRDLVDTLREGIVNNVLDQFNAGEAMDEGPVDLNGITANFISCPAEVGGETVLYTMTSFTSDANIIYILSLAVSSEAGNSEAGIEAYGELLESIDIK